MRPESDRIPFVGASEIVSTLDLPSLIDAIEDAFRDPPPVPSRTQNVLPEGRLLVMPAWAIDGVGGVKLAVALPANRNTDLPEIQATYVLFDERGRLRAVLDGHALTLLRTAAASAVASRRLARGDVPRLLLVGAGALGPWLARAHATVRPVRSIRVWSRSQASVRRACALLEDLCDDVAPAEDLDREVGQADLICCATPSRSALVRGARVSDGTHVDLVGSFTPQMRESDGDLLRRARLFVDSREGALDEAGDVIQAIGEGVIGADHIAGDLTELVIGRVSARSSESEITVFKSVGHALEDLVAARLVCERLGV